MVGNGGVNANQVATEVDEGTTRIAGVHHGIGLQERFEAHIILIAQNTDTPALGRNNTGRHGRVQVEGVAHGEHPLTHFHVIGVTKFHKRQVISLHLEHS